MLDDPHLAQDVSQGVFLALAKDAARLTHHPALVGWLHTTTRNIAAQTVRTQVRRREREKVAANMNDDSEAVAEWEEIAPHLDAALADLSEPDRDAVLLRYFQNKPAQEMAGILGISAEAAQKRVSRAVERLRRNFAKRGITAGAGGLTGMISANAVQAAPAGPASLLASAATQTAATIQVLAMTTFQKSLVAATITALASFGVYQADQASQLRQEVQTLQHEGGPPAGASRERQEANRNSSHPVRGNERSRRQNTDREAQLAAKEKELINTKKDLEIAQALSASTEEIMAKLASGEELQIPQTMPELSVFCGQLQLRSRNFYEKWNGRIPEKNTPQEVEYKQELDDLVTDEATLLKGLNTLTKDGNFDMGDPATVAQFQSMQVYGALGLNESQWQQLDGKLNAFYQEFYGQKLSVASRPDTAVEAWEERRNQMSRKAFAEIQASFTPQQRADFLRIYSPLFLLAVDAIGLRPRK